MTSYPADAFRDSRVLFDNFVETLSGADTQTLDHAAVESLIGERGIALLRQLFQDHIDLRSSQEAGAPMTGADGVKRTERRASSCGLETLFGGVTVRRLALVKKGTSGGLRPLDAHLNLPGDSFSFGVREHVAREAAQGSFNIVVERVARMTGASLAKRQAEHLAVAAARDFDSFYDHQPVVDDVSSHLLVLTFDGKGVVMRPEALRPATRRAAEKSKSKLKHRTSPGEKRGRKRMAQVAALYDLEAVARTPDDIFRELSRSGPHQPRPKPENKRVWASLDRAAADVVDDGFYAATLRDPNLERSWVALVDGNKDQLRYIRSSAASLGVELTIVMDFIHVLEYLWTAAWAFHDRQDDDDARQAEVWVTERARRLLEGKVSLVAAGMRRSATRRGLTGSQRKAVDTCANYLLKHKRYLRYDVYLRQGLPIATGVIEGACRSLVKDRMDVTGARWGLEGGEAILKLRSLAASGDFDAYWSYHQQRELVRNHLSNFASTELVELRRVA